MPDLLVAGGGPAGLATALYAVRAGLDVAVWEPRAGVVDKACGEGLMPGAVQALADLGVDPPGRPLTGIRYLTPDRSAQARFSRGPGRGVRRTTLHAALCDAVAAAGVHVACRRVERIVPGKRDVLVDGVRARYLVAADGLHSPIRHSLGLQLPASRTRRYGLRVHVQMPPWTSYVEVHWSPTAEAYVTPVSAGLVGIAVLGSDRRPFAEQVADFPALAARAAGHRFGPVRGAGPLAQDVRARVAGRVLLVGDAAGYVDALTGEGIALGLASAKAAVTAIAAGRPADYEREWRRITRRYRLVTRALLAGSRLPAMRRALVPAAAAAPWLFSAVVDLLAGPHDRLGREEKVRSQ